MAPRKKSVPRFESEAEEAAFWEKHSPLEFYKEEEFKPLRTQAPLDRPVTVRLDSRLRKLLEEFASAHHLGPSTAVRTILEQALARFERQRKVGLTLEDILTSVWERIPAHRQQELERLVSEATIGDSESPAFLILNAREAERAFRLIFRYLLAVLGADILVPGDEEYEALKARARS